MNQDHQHRLRGQGGRQPSDHVREGTLGDGLVVD